MTIQFNSDNNLSVHQEFRAKLDDQLKEELSRFSDSITRIEVHMSDQNGSKEGLDDKRCLLEARMEGRPPIAATGFGNNYEMALNVALDKLKAALTTIKDRLKNH